MTVSASSRLDSYAGWTKAQLIDELEALKDRFAESRDPASPSDGNVGEAFFGLIADSLPAMIFYVDAKGRYRMVNRTCEQWFARPRAEIIGRHFSEILGEDAAAKVAAQMANASADEPTLREDWRLYPDGVDRFVRAYGTPRLSPEGALLGYFVMVDDITDAKRTEAALAEANQYLSAIFENSPFLIALKDVDSRYRVANREFLRVYGLREEEIIGRRPQEIFPDNNGDVMQAHDMKAMRGPEVLEANLRVDTVDGPRILSQSKFPVLDPDGNVAGVGFIGADITERVRAAEALKDSEARFKDFAQSASDWFWELDADLRYRDFSAPEEITGRPPHEAIGKTRWEFLGIDPNADDRWCGHKATLEAHETFRDFQYAVVSPTGATHWWSISGVPVFAEDGSFQGYRGSATDITDRKHVEEEIRVLNEELEQRVGERTAELSEEIKERKRVARELQASEARISALLQHSPAAISLKDSSGKYLLANDVFKKVLGVSGDEYKGRTSHDLVSKEQADAFRAHDLTVLESGRVVEQEDHFHIDGSDRTMLTVKFPVHDADGTIVATGAIATDITERKRAEAALAESEGRLRLITDSLPVLISYVDKDLCWRFNNHAYQDWFGLDPAKIYGQSLREGLGEAAYEGIRCYVEKVLAGVPVDYESRVPFAQGGDRYIRASYVPHLGEDGEVLGFFSIVSDVSELKRAEDDLRMAQEELVRKERLATLGQLTGSVSHELRNPLGTVRTAVAVIENRVRDKNLGVEKTIARLNRNIGRCDKIIDEMLAYARTRKIVREETDICAWLEETFDDFEIPRGISVRREFSSGGPPLAVDRDRLRRALVNVYDNACQAMVLGDGEKVLTVGAREKGGRFEFSFSDTGQGMTPEILTNVFEPLYSTKNFGVGLGLPIVKQIMEQHDGGVEITSTEKQGTESVLWMPISNKEDFR